MEVSLKRQRRIVRIDRHPAEWFKAEIAAGRLSEMPELTDTWKADIPSDEDFVVRFCSRRGTTSAALFVRNEDGSLTGFLDSPFEIELIGTNAERWAEAVRTKSVGGTIGLPSGARKLAKRATTRARRRHGGGGRHPARRKEAK
jgi:hypothetical protein